MVKIEVTAQDIERGEPGNCRSCPIALAIRRATKTCKTVRVFNRNVFLGMRAETCISVSLPSEATAFAMRFDRRQDVKPFSFDLDISP